MNTYNSSRAGSESVYAAKSNVWPLFSRSMPTPVRVGRGHRRRSSGTCTLQLGRLARCKISNAKSPLNSTSAWSYSTCSDSGCFVFAITCESRPTPCMVESQLSLLCVVSRHSSMNSLRKAANLKTFSCPVDFRRSRSCTTDQFKCMCAHSLPGSEYLRTKCVIVRTCPIPLLPSNLLQQNCIQTTAMTGVISYDRESQAIFTTHPIENSHLFYQIGSADPEAVVQAAKSATQDVSGIYLQCSCSNHCHSFRDGRSTAHELRSTLRDSDSIAGCASSGGVLVCVKLVVKHLKNIL